MYHGILWNIMGTCGYYMWMCTHGLVGFALFDSAVLLALSRPSNVDFAHVSARGCNEASPDLSHLVDSDLSHPSSMFGFIWIHLDVSLIVLQVLRNFPALSEWPAC